jgi:hypothetical protein
MWFLWCIGVIAMGVRIGLPVRGRFGAVCSQRVANPSLYSRATLTREMAPRTLKKHKNQANSPLGKSPGPELCIFFML